MPGILFVLFAAALAGWCLQFVLALPARFPAAAPTLHVDAIAIGLLGLALAALAPWACRPPPAASLLAGALVGALVCLRIFGWAVLDPTATGWVLQGDLAQHYVGWAFFRDEAWQWPPGAIAGLGYPVGTSVFYTDAHPLLAFLFKPLSGLLPRPFQYIGLTYLLNWPDGKRANWGWLKSQKTYTNRYGKRWSFRTCPTGCESRCSIYIGMMTI